MTLDMSNTEKLVDFRQDAAASHRGRAALGPDLLSPFPDGPNRIYYALAAIKGVGEGTVDHIVEVRGDKTFDSIEDFCLRIDPKQINRRVFEA